MNFLEQLAAEWYEYNGYFVRTNIKFGRNAGGRGGHAGEIDVIGFKPETHVFVHIEASTDARGPLERKKRFERQFTNAREYYMEIFPFKEIGIKPKQIAIVGFNLNINPAYENWKSLPPTGSLWGDLRIEVIHIPIFIKQIAVELKNRDPQNEAIPETLPLLRAIQYTVFYNKI